MGQPGTFIAVCGPSGAGKDTVMRLARTLLAGRGDVIFARRVITRAADDAEDNEPASPEAFARRLRDGQFMLAWQAHGLSYGLPVDLLDALRRGQSVVANVSRGILGDARRLGVPFCIIEITASSDVLAQRLAGRGREDDGARGARVARNALYSGGISADHVVLNDGAPLDAAQQIAQVIEGCLAHQPTPAA